MTTTKTTKREKDTGRYAPSTERVCACGHGLGLHTAARTAGEQPCLAWELLGVECACDCFKAARK